MSMLLPTIASDDDEAYDDENDEVAFAGGTTKGDKKNKKSKKKKDKTNNKKNANATKKAASREEESSSDDDDDDGDDVDSDFEFGGLLGEDDDGGDGFAASMVNVGRGGDNNDNSKNNQWSYRSALDLLARNDAAAGGATVERTNVASIIAAARSNLKKKEQKEEEEQKRGVDEADRGGGGGGADDDGDDVDGSSSKVKEARDERRGTEEESSSSDDGGGSGSSSSSSDGSESDSDTDDEVDDEHAAQNAMERDVLRVRERRAPSNNKAKATKKGGGAGSADGGGTDETPSDSGSGDDSDEEGSESEESSSSWDDDNSEDDEAKAEAAKAAAYFETADASPSERIEAFSQLSLSRPLLRGVASMGFVTPTPIQGSVIPVALAGRDVCASAVTGSGKTAAFLLPVMERILQRGGGASSSSGGGGGKRRGAAQAAAATRALVLTPTRELAAQCVGMMSAMAKFTGLRAALVVGGARNIAAQAAELRTRPDVVIATPGRLLDHLTNSPGVDLDDLEFLILDEADRLLDLGFQDEVHEIVKSCPMERQTLLFSATMGTKVDDLVKLSLKRPVRVRVSDKKRKNRGEASGGGDGELGADGGVEVAPRLEQEFVRVRTGNEGASREGMLLALLTRTFKSRAIVFFDTKATAHRLMIICGLCGMKCAELHGNLTQTQRLEALEAFREGEVDVLLATDLAARGLDIPCVDSVVNFEMPSNVDTYVHRIGRTARAGRGGKSCTLIGEGRRYLMKEVIKDAAEKSGRASASSGRKPSKDASTAGIIRSRTIPPAVVAHFVAKITSLEPHIEEVLAAEAVAKMDRIAEMEATRAKNIIEHSNEIKSRPQREWFASNKQKLSAKEAAAEKQKMIAEKVGTGKHRMTRKKRRAREAQEDLMRAQEEMQREREEAGKQPKKLLNDKSIKSSARALKKQEARREKENFGKSLHDDDQAREFKKRQLEKNKKKRKGAFASDSMGDGSLFEEEKVSFAKKAKKESVAASSYKFSDFDPNMKKRKSSKKSVKAFKSKSKHKRR